MISHDVATELAIDAVIDFAELEPGAIEEIFQRGVIPQWGADAKRLHPDLWPTTQAAKKAYQRAALDLEQIFAELREAGLCKAGQRGTFPYKYLYKAMSPSAALIKFQPAGPRAKQRLVLVDPVKVRDARSRLEAALGPLALFEIVGDAKPKTPVLELVWSKPGSNFAARLSAGEVPARSTYQFRCEACA